MPSHLLLSLNFVLDQQKTIKNLESKVRSLEEENQRQRSNFMSFQTNITSLKALLDQHDHKLNQNLQDEISKHENMSLRRMNEINSNIQTDINRLSRTIQELNIQIREVKGQRK
jgi:chromosome segregation ATPase